MADQAVNITNTIGDSPTTSNTQSASSITDSMATSTADTSQSSLTSDHGRRTKAKPSKSISGTLFDMHTRHYTANLQGRPFRIASASRIPKQSGIGQSNSTPKAPRKRTSNTSRQNKTAKTTAMPNTQNVIELPTTSTSAGQNIQQLVIPKLNPVRSSSRTRRATLRGSTSASFSITSITEAPKRKPADCATISPETLCAFCDLSRELASKRRRLEAPAHTSLSQKKTDENIIPLQSENNTPNTSGAIVPVETQATPKQVQLPATPKHVQLPASSGEVNKRSTGAPIIPSLSPRALPYNTLAVRNGAIVPVETQATPKQVQLPASSGEVSKGSTGAPIIPSLSPRALPYNTLAVRNGAIVPVETQATPKQVQLPASSGEVNKGSTGAPIIPSLSPKVLSYNTLAVRNGAIVPVETQATPKQEQLPATSGEVNNGSAGAPITPSLSPRVLSYSTLAVGNERFAGGRVIHIPSLNTIQEYNPNVHDFRDTFGRISQSGYRGPRGTVIQGVTGTQGGRGTGSLNIKEEPKDKEPLPCPKRRCSIM